MIWVKWDSIDQFDLWHDAIKTELGLPKMSVGKNGEIDPTAVVSTDYVLPTIVAENDIRALISEIYAEGLEISENPQPENYMTNE